MEKATKKNFNLNLNYVAMPSSGNLNFWIIQSERGKP